jgi:hypothetical protein
MSFDTFEIEDEKCSTEFDNFDPIITERILSDPLLALGDNCQFRLAYYNEERDLDDDDHCIGRIKKGEKMPVFSGEGELYNSSCDDKQYVLKVQKEYNRNEIKFQIDASSAGIAPPIYEVWFCFGKEPGPDVCPTTSLFVMKRYNLTYKEILPTASPQEREFYLNAAIDLLRRLHMLYIYHQDCHLANFMTGFNDDIVLIDYGRASRYNEKNDFNILYNEIYMLSIPTGEKSHLLSIIPNIQPKGNPPLLNAADPKEEVKTTAQKMGFTRIGKFRDGARSSGFVRQQTYDDDEDEDDY